MSNSNIQAILAAAAQQQVELWFEGDRLRFRVPSRGLPANLRASLTECKVEILAALRQEAAQTIHEFPLSYGQQALWFLHQVAPESASYHVAFTARIFSPLDVSALRLAFQTLVDRHASLRAMFPATHGVPVQRVPGYTPIAFTEIDATSWDDEQLYQTITSDYRQPFDLAVGPLFRVSIYSSAQSCVLLITIHHIIIDGWSLWILLDELRTLYAAGVSNSPAGLPGIGVEYSDFIRWQADLLTNQEEELWKFWKAQLPIELPSLNLPEDHPRPSVQTYHGAAMNFILDTDLSARLKALAKVEGVTLFTLLLAAFQALLHRYTGQGDIIVGTPTFGRNEARFAKVVGYFVNMIPLHADFSTDLTFRDFLAQTRQRTLASLDHQDYPFPRLVARLGAGHDASQSPIFQATFDLQRVQGFGDLAALFIPGRQLRRFDFGGLTLEPYPIHQQEGQFDLSLQMTEFEEMLPADIKYNTDIFDASTIQRMIGHFRVLLEGIVTNPETCIAALPLLTPQEYHQILVEWNNTKAEYSEACIHHLFEAQVDQTPEAIAVIDTTGGITGIKNVTYRDLNQWANQLARHLSKAGVKPETIIGVCLNRSTELIIALLGILKVGGAYLPLDPAYPPERLDFMVKDAGALVLITQENLVEQLPQNVAQIIRIDSDWPVISKETQDNLKDGAASENLAYVIYTSGSTGLPKGVQIEHRALADHCRDMLKYYQFTPQDRALQFSSPNFDASLEQIFTTLITGAGLVLRESELWLPMDFSNKITELSLTVVNIPPAYWHQWVQETARSAEPAPIERLRLVIVGGDAMLTESLKLWQATPMRSVRLINAYGPTETTITATTFNVPVEQSLAESLRRVPIGRPRANRKTYILDRYGNPVPVGITGELFIGGAGLARGYLNRKDLTAERFIPDPFSQTPGARMYKTGDLAHYLPDGNIDFLGRADFQVKIRGFRIELGEIESVLMQHPAIGEAVVVVREDTHGDPRLIAYITVKTEKATNRELRNFLKNRLPIYMVPSTFIILEAFPLNPSGKIDRRALPAPDSEGLEMRAGSPGTQKAAHPPQTVVEKLIAESWQRVLSVSQVSLFDNFFDLGGHSLLVMQVVADLQEKTGKRLDPAYLRFETLGQLAATFEKILA